MLKKLILLSLLTLSYICHADTNDEIATQRWDTFSDIANSYLSDASADEFIQRGDQEKSKWGNYPGALSYYFMAFDRNKNSIMAPYQAAGSLVYLGLNKDAKKYLLLADKNGFWQYHLMAEDEELAPIKDSIIYQQVLNNAKQRYKIQAADAGKARIFTPKSKQPQSGWPVIVWLSGYGTEGSDSKDIADALSSISAIFIGINGTEKINAHTFRWSNKNITSTNDAVQSALQQVEKKYKINKNKIVLMGFSQGSLHAAQLLAHYPEQYAGGLLISSGGWQQTLPTSNIENHNIVISYGDNEHVSNINLDKNIINYFSPKNNVTVHTHEGGHFFSNNWKQDYPQYLRQILNN